MQRNQAQIRFSALRQAFTLVELLVVCVIIIILAALTLAAVNVAAHSAKVAKTRATIQKLDAAMLQIFESYESKFTTIKRKVNSALPKEEQQKIAAHFIRDTMRMEMPQCWAEVHKADGIKSKPITITLNGTNYNVDESPLLEYYWQAYINRIDTGHPPSRAALLFLIIQNLNPEALTAFHGSEVVRNADGMLEFVDAWGRPILFLRWAPAFPDSDLQQNVLKRAGYTPTSNPADNRNWWLARDADLLAAMKEASAAHPDQTDERKESIGWFLYPLIYSAGADGKYGLDDGLLFDTDQGTAIIGSEGILDPFAFPFGLPLGRGSEHFDNIHNHQWYR